MKTGYYQADCVNGVHFIGKILDDADQEVTRADIFEMKLKDLSENEVIVAFFDESTRDIFESIESHYGEVK